MSKDELYKLAFEKTSLAGYSRAYLKDIIDTPYEDGKRKGIMEARLEVKLEAAKFLKDNGKATDFIMKVTGLCQAGIDRL